MLDSSNDPNDVAVHVFNGEARKGEDEKREREKERKKKKKKYRVKEQLDHRQLSNCILKANQVVLVTQEQRETSKEMEN